MRKNVVKFLEFRNRFGDRRGSRFLGFFSHQNIQKRKPKAANGFLENVRDLSLLFPVNICGPVFCKHFLVMSKKLLY